MIYLSMIHCYNDHWLTSFLEIYKHHEGGAKFQHTAFEGGSKNIACGCRGGGKFWLCAIFGFAPTPPPSTCKCCGQLWVWHMFCGRDLWWAIPLHIFHWSCWDTIWIPIDHMDLCQTHCKQVPDFFRLWGHMVNGWSTWVVLWLLFFRSAPSTFPNKRSAHRGPFPEVPSR